MGGLGLAVVITLIVFVGIPILIAISTQRKANRASKDRLNTLDIAFEEFKSDVLELGKSALKSNSTNVPEILKKLHEHAKQRHNELVSEYYKANNITTTMDSSSSLGICGVSHTDFWYKIDADFSLKFSFIFGKSWSIDSDLNNYKQIEDKIEKEKGHTGFALAIPFEKELSEVANFRTKVDYYRRVDEPAYPIISYSIPLSNIQYFKVEGTEQFVSEVSGGGVNLQGAVVGGLLAGGAAAVIGSQVGTETKTNIIKKDDRRIVIVYTEKTELKVLEVKSDDIGTTLGALRKLMPKKEESVFLNKQTVKSDSNTNIDDIKKFKELLDSGIITQEEFDAKKKQLLGL